MPTHSPLTPQIRPRCRFKSIRLAPTLPIQSSIPRGLSNPSSTSRPQLLRKLRTGLLRTRFTIPQPSPPSIQSSTTFSPPGSAFASTTSTPQPAGDDHSYFERVMLDMRQTMPNLSAPRAPPIIMPQYMFNPNSDQIFNAVTASTMPPFATSTFPLTDHVNPNQVLNPDFVTSRQNSLLTTNDASLFIFGESDGERRRRLWRLCRQDSANVTRGRHVRGSGWRSSVGCQPQPIWFLCSEIP